MNLREAIGLSLGSNDDLVKRCVDGVRSIVGNVEQSSPNGDSALSAQH
jgi:hypothetical protein